MATTTDKRIDQIIIRPNGEVTIVELTQVIETTTLVRQVPGVIDPEQPEVNPGMVDETYEESTVVSSNFIRRSIRPGESYAEEDQRVKDICALVHSETYLGYPITQANLSGKWEAFNTYILSEPNYNFYTDVVSQTSKFLPAYLADAYALINKSGFNNFQTLYTMFCNIGSVSQEHKDLWADKASSIGLPADFCALLRSSIS